VLLLDAFFSFLKVAAIGFFALAALFLVLLATRSQFRALVLEALGWTVASGCAAALVSPVDLVPDFIPVAGQLDDLGYIVVGLLCAVLAYMQHRTRCQANAGLPAAPKLTLPWKGMNRR
jgi:uncharacterized membrane protein YkvA (DUF1232 family)